jgi:hypothetical protein
VSVAEHCVQNRGGRPASLAADLDRLNRCLRDGLAVVVTARAPTGSRFSIGGDLMAVVLSETLPDGRRRHACRPLRRGRHDRTRRLALAASLAECAMSLGLGAGIYRTGIT